MNQAPRWVVKVKKSGTSSDYVDISDSVLKLSFTDSESKVDKVSATMDNYEARVFDNPLIAHGNLLQFSLGYVDGKMSPTYECVIRKVTGGDEVVVEANAKSILMDSKKLRKAYRNMTRSQVVQEIAKRYGYSGTTAVIEDTSEVLSQVTQHNITDAMMLKKLADLQGFVFWVSFDGLHWHSRDLQQAPSRELTYFTEKGKGSIYNYSVENDVTRMPGRIKAKARDPLTKKTLEATADNETDADRTILQVEKALTEFRLDIDEESLVVTTGDFGLPQDESVPSAEQTQQSINTEAKKKFRQTTLSAVKMNLSCIGDPTLLAKTIIKVNGLGTRLSGKYYVKEVVHELDGVGYDMQIKVTTDGYRKNTAKKCSLDTSVYRYLDEIDSASNAVTNDRLRQNVKALGKNVRQAVAANNVVEVRKALNSTASVVQGLQRYSTQSLTSRPEALATVRAINEAFALLTPCLDPDNAASGRPNDKDVADPNALEERLYIDQESLQVRTDFSSAYSGQGYFDGEIKETKAIK